MPRRRHQNCANDVVAAGGNVWKQVPCVLRNNDFLSADEEQKPGVQWEMNQTEKSEFSVTKFENQAEGNGEPAKVFTQWSSMMRDRQLDNSVSGVQDDLG